MKLEPFVDRLSFGEGPRWHQGKLWYSDFYVHQVRTADENGRTETVVEAGKAVLIESDHQPDPLLTIKDYPGHTPGSIAINLRDGGQQASFAGDIMHHPIQVYHPDWSSQFCSDQALSAKSRRKLLEDCVESNALLCPAHFPGANAGHIKPEGNAFKIEWDKA